MPANPRTPFLVMGWSAIQKIDDGRKRAAAVSLAKYPFVGRFAVGTAFEVRQGDVRMPLVVTGIQDVPTLADIPNAGAPLQLWGLPSWDRVVNSLRRSMRHDGDDAAGWRIILFDVTGPVHGTIPSYAEQQQIKQARRQEHKARRLTPAS